MRQAASLKDLRLGMLLPGITINTSPTDYAPIKQMQMRRFDGMHWDLFGPLREAALAERDVQEDASEGGDRPFNRWRAGS